MTDLTNRQWRALAQAYPFFVPEGASSPDATALAPGRDNNAVGTQGSAASPEEFTACVLPRLRNTFPDELDAYERLAGAQRQRTTPDVVRGEGSSAPSLLTTSAMALLTHFFGGSSPSPLLPSLTAKDKERMQRCFDGLIQPLTCREQHLLGLYHRKQQQYIHVLRTRQALLAASQSAIAALHAASDPILDDSTGHVEASQQEMDFQALPTCCNTSVPLDHRRSALRMPPRALHGDGAADTPSPPVGPLSGPPAFGAGPTPPVKAIFTSALAHLPYNDVATIRTTSAVVSSERDHACFSASTDQSLVGGAAALMSVARCAGCQEAGGDLLMCTQCGELRHEACGGPHPQEPHRVDGALPGLSVCRQCAKQLNLSSSSSSLRSSTSSSEREKLDAYFSSDDDDDSSLSGFVVRTSDEGEEEEEDEEGEAYSPTPLRGGTGYSQEAPRNSRKRGRDKRGQRGKEHRKVTVDFSSSSSTSSPMWSRAASLDRALASKEKSFDASANAASAKRVANAKEKRCAAPRPVEKASHTVGPAESKRRPFTEGAASSGTSSDAEEDATLKRPQRRGDEAESDEGTSHARHAMRRPSEGKKINQDASSANRGSLPEDTPSSNHVEERERRKDKGAKNTHHRPPAVTSANEDDEELGMLGIRVGVGSRPMMAHAAERVVKAAKGGPEMGTRAKQR